MHAPVGEGFAGGRWGAPLSLASTDAAARAKALAEAEQALHIARRMPFGVLVVHLGLPRSQHPAPADNSRDAARRSIESLRERAASLGVKVAVEVMPNELSRSGSLVHFVEEVLDEPVGICLDFGHAHLEGDLVEAIETVSEHLLAVDLHDNRGRFDEHLVPFEGTIDWPGALTAVQKVGFEGPLMLELAPHGSTKESAGPGEEGQAANGALAGGLMTHTMHVYIEDIGRHEGDEVTIKGWLHNRRSSGKIHFLILRDGSGFIQAVMSKAAVGDELFATADHLGQETSVIVTGTARADKRAPSGYEIDVKSLRGGWRVARLPDLRRRSTASTSCSIAAICGSAPSGSRRSCACATRSSTPSATSSTSAGSSSPTRRSSRRPPARGRPRSFPAQYFEDQTAYLTQSGQLYNEANAMALGRVYCFGPTFRAEKSKTRRHLTEFWMVEPEMAYASLDDVMNLAEALIVVDCGARARASARASSRCSNATPHLSSACRRRSRGSPTTTRSSGCRRRACRSSGAATSADRTKRRCRPSSIDP